MNRRYTKTEVYDSIKSYCCTNSSGVSDMVKLDETPDVIKHSCVQTGVTFLQSLVWNVPIPEEYYIQVPFYYCSCCGKLYVKNNIYE